MRSLFFLIFYSSIIFPRGREHEFNAVFLVDLRRRRVIIDRHDVLVLVHPLQRAHGALARDVVGQTAERLGADDVVGTRFGERRHLRRDQPALAHLHALVDDLVGTAAQVFEIVQRLEAVLFRDSDDLLLNMVQIFVNDIENRGRDALFVVQLGVVYVVDGTVHHKVHQRGHDRLAPLGEQKLLQMGIAERRIFDVNFADDADLDLLFLTPLHLGKTLEQGAHHLFVLAVPALCKLFADVFHAVGARLVAFPCLQFVRFALVVQRHERIPVKDGVCELQDGFEVHGETAVLFQSRKIEGNDGNLGELRLERLADERDIVGRAAAAARLGDEYRRMLDVVFSALERVDELPRDAQRGEAGIVVNVFEPLVDDGARIVAQKLDVPAVPPQDVDDDSEMHGKHIRHQNFVRMFHFGGEFRVIVAEVRRFAPLYRLFILHPFASFVPRWRRACCADGS